MTCCWSTMLRPTTRLRLQHSPESPASSTPSIRATRARTSPGASMATSLDVTAPQESTTSVAAERVGLERVSSTQARALIGVGGAVVIGTVLRLITPGAGPLWRDEALFLFIVQLPSVSEVLSFLYQHESHPPLFYLIMRAWGSIAGTSEAALNVLPILFSIALIPSMFWVGSRAFGKATGLFACWIVALHPGLIFHSVQIRPYALLTLLAIGSCYWLTSMIRGEGARRSWVLYVLTTLGMLYIHHWSWLLLGAQGALVAATLVLFRTRAASHARQVVYAWAAIGVGYMPLLPMFLRQARVSGHFPDKVGVHDAIIRLADVGVSYSPIHLGAAVLVLVIGAVAIRPRARFAPQPLSLAAYFFLGLIAPMAVLIAVPLSHRSNMLVGRTMTTLVPFVSLLVANGLASMIADRRMATAALTGCLITVAMGMTTISYALGIKSNAGDLAAAVAARSEASDVIIIAPDRFASSFNYYFEPDNQQIGYPNPGRQEALFFDDWYERVADVRAFEAGADSIRAFRARGARVWLVTEHTMLRDTFPNQIGRAHV